MDKMFNNQFAMSQMNQMMNNENSNNLYIQNIQPTWKNMQPNVYLNEINFNNMSNILSLINLPILVPYHIQHPLVNCKTPGRAEISPSWKCNCCQLDYSYNIPTFYCTACDFDLCQKCFLSLSAFMIGIYNYNLSYNYASQQFSNFSHYKENIHKHPIVRILREPTYSEIKLKCNSCFKDILKEEQFYYCGLCNFCICINCYENKKQQPFIDNPYYLSCQQMNSNK